MTTEGEGLQLLESAVELRELFVTGKPVALVFSAPWCSPCRMFAPEAKALAEACQEKLLVRGIVYGSSIFDELSTRYQVSNIPEVLLFEEGELSMRFDANPYSDLLKEMMAAAGREGTKAIIRGILSRFQK